MSSHDAVRITQTMTFLLHHEPARGDLLLDADGWVAVPELLRAMSSLLRSAVAADAVERAVAWGTVRRFELSGDRIRAAPPNSPRRARNPRMPDILYHATTADRLARFGERGLVTGGRDQPLYLSSDEEDAWRVAHRLKGDAPVVLYVDASRARRRGTRFSRCRRPGLYQTRSVPVPLVLNLQQNFAKQLSAGGIPMVVAPDGVPRLALIRVTRRSGVTWEVAKGKLEPGEPPEIAGVREVREEMGLDTPLRIVGSLGEVRYGFMAPGAQPRLKVVYLYLMEPTAPIETFNPSEREGIGAVRWFTPDEAARAVTHSSLVPLMQRVRDMLTSPPAAPSGEALDPGPTPSASSDAPLEP